MKERPILMSAPMVRAILDGTKTQTRRAIKPVGNDGGFVLLDHGDGLWPHRSDDGDSTFHTVKRGGKEYLDETPHMCPYGQPGDRLWVREAFRFLDSFDGDSPARVGNLCLNAGYQKPWAPTLYEADGERDNWMNVGTVPGSITAGKLRPGIHMPRWAGRILLEITAVRVERLQDISEADALAEGCALECMTPTGDDSCSAIHGPGGFRALWSSINGAEIWDQNPWVWVIQFQLTEVRDGRS